MVHIKKLSVSTEKCSNAGVVFSTIKQIKYFFTFQRVYISKKKKKSQGHGTISILNYKALPISL